MNDAYVEKRDGSIVRFDPDKLKNAVRSAFRDTGEHWNEKRLFKRLRKNIVRSGTVETEGRAVYPVEQIQDVVEDTIAEVGYIKTAKAYVRYRYQHELERQKKNDNEFLSMLEGKNEYWYTENSNKNAEWVTTQRDYLAGIASKDLARKYIFPKEIMEAHDKGIIHIHDLDYAAQPISNCCLCNLEDMLQNGTAINGVCIDKPHRLITAATLASQIIASVASSQFGGTTVTLTHLAPFVRDSYNRYVQKYQNWGMDEEHCAEYAMADTRREVTDAMQTLIYQLNSLTTTNGQSPFITIFMYLNETDEYKGELAMLIEEMLNQRYQGMKNRQGVYVSPAFPKLIYVLEEDNIREGTPYWYLTQLAAKVSAKRLVPDYVSEKVMLENKIDKNGDGHCYPPMGLDIY